MQLTNRHSRFTHTALTLFTVVALAGITASASADEEAAASHGVRFTDSSGEETPKTIGFLVHEGETGALAAGSINQSQGGPDLVYFFPGEHLVWYASGILWVGDSESIARTVEAERQRLADMDLLLRDVTSWPTTLDGQTPQQQGLRSVQLPFAQAHGPNWPFVWAAQHNEELVRAREAAAVAAARPAPTPSAPLAVAQRIATGDGQTKRFLAGMPVLGAYIRLDDGRSCLQCWIVTAPIGGIVTSGAYGVVFPGELITLTEWKP